MIRLDQVAEIKAGAAIRGKLPIDHASHVRIVQQSNITEAGIQGALERVHYEKAERDCLKDGDVLLRSKGEPNIAAAFTVSEIGELPTIAAPAVLVIRPKRDHLVPGFLAWLLNTPQCQTALARISTGTQLSVIPARDLREVEISVPSMERQLAISEIVKLSRAQENLARQYRQKVDELCAAIINRKQAQ